MPEPTTAPALSRLAAQMRARGARVGVGELLAAHRALAAVDAGSREEAYFALRAALCSSRADLATFAEAFATVFAESPAERHDPLEELGQVARMALPRVGVLGEAAGRAELEPAPVPAAWSEEELLRDKDFALYTDAERAAARRLLTRLARRGPRRLSRRTNPTRRRRDVHDLRATLRVSLRHGGELVERRFRTPAERPRRLVLICDVSGSMAPYARMLLQYLQACVAARARVEAFVFGTRLTRVTGELAGRDPDRALRRAAEHVPDWSGGTRIGAALAELNRLHGRRIGRGALVVVLSDGWDRGDPEELAAEMARLARCAHRVVWLNP
ncbi:MAG TPA: VWA domain-containing protein, partial [Solirubrobacteraceae bacterium]|nr:VWA domain-containing protein [Solirubrobacteraceae bacterium]